ncbi:MAG: penicillin acylase family protein, partial [Myxococcales bacterium]
DRQRLGEHHARGSNNWVLAPSRTKNKRGLLANDPHLSLGNPSIWFPIEVDGKSKGTGKTHVAGGSFPGLPLVMTGHNDDLAWGVTTVYYDLTDVYEETLTDDGKSVLFNGAPVAIIEKELEFADSSTGTPVKKTLQWVPHHGPIVSVDAANKKALSVRWVAQGGSTDLEGFMNIGRATTTAEAREGLRSITSANQNFVVVDRQGDIGWFPYGKIPKRPWASPDLSPWTVLPGDGTAEWDGFVDVADLPQAYNPPKGFLATANQDITGASFDGDPTNDGQQALQSWEKAEGAREQRIVDVLEAGGNDHTTDTMHALQGDTRVLLAESIVPALVAAAAASTEASVLEIGNALKDWAFTCPTGLVGSALDSAKSTDAVVARESIGCAAFHVALYAVERATLGDELAAAQVSVGSTDQAVFLARALSKPETLTTTVDFWDDVTTADVKETRDETLRRGLAQAATLLAPLGASDEWRWGRIHALTLRSIFDNFGVPTYNDGPWATPGGLNTVNVSNPASTTKVDGAKKPDLGPSSGPSLRTVIEITEQGPRMTFQYPGGADLHRDSPFYNNLVEGWLTNTGVAFPFGPDAVTSPAKQVTVQP